MRKVKTLSDHFASIFPGKVRKIAVNAGLGCPNRDGTVGTGGCIYCNNAAFNPAYAFNAGAAARPGIREQVEAGIRFAGAKGAAAGYLPYFQTYSNTYGDAGRLIQLYEEALACPGVVGLVIATRPDCLAPGILEYFERRFGHKAPAGHPYLLVELGIESTEDKTLERINRGHDWRCSVEAVNALDKIGVDVGAHIILGLPGEGKKEWELHARRLSALPVKTLKLHQLQVVKGTRLAEMYAEDKGCVTLFTAEGYARAVADFVAVLREDIALDRVVSETPKDLLLAPSWGLKPAEFAEILKRTI